MFYKGIVGLSLPKVVPFYIQGPTKYIILQTVGLYTISLLHALVCDVVLIGTSGIKNGVFSFFLSLSINSF